MESLSCVDLSIRSRASSHVLAEARERRMGGGRSREAGTPPPSGDGGGCSSPPTNRGEEITRGEVDHGIHWLTTTVFGPVEVVLDLLVKCLPGFSRDDRYWEAFTEAKGGGFYARRFVGPYGIVVTSDPITPGAPLHCSVRFTGKTCEQITSLGIKSWLLALERSLFRWKLTRVDSAWDRSGASPELCFAAAKRGDVRTRLKLLNRLGEGPPDEEADCPVKHTEDGWGRKTFAMRSQTWGLCVYDRRGFNRVEFRAFGAKAECIGDMLLCRPVEEWSRRLLGYMRRCVDFIDRASDANVSRCSLLSWWGELVAAAESVKFVVAKAARSSEAAAARELLSARTEKDRAVRKLASLPADLKAEALTDLERMVVDPPPRVLARRRSYEAAARLRSAADSWAAGLYSESMRIPVAE